MNLFWQFICVITFGGACWAIGDIVLNVLLGKNIDLPHLGRPSLAFAVGNIAMSYLLTFIGFVGGFVPTVLWVLFGGGVGITIWRIIGQSQKAFHSRSVNQAIREEARKKEKWTPYLLIVIIGLFYIPAVLQAAAPPYVRDSLVYHLLCPKEYLKAGHLVHIEGNIFSAFPKGHEVLMTLLLSISGDRAAQGFSFLQQIAAIGELYSLTYLMTGFLPAAICVVGYATVPPVMYFTGCGYVEPALLMTLGGSLFVLFICLRSARSMNTSGSMGPGRISLLGFLAGWMPALKYSGLIYLGLIGLILFWNYRKVSSIKALRVIWVFGISAAPGLSWMAWNWMSSGNPVYPMAWGLFGGRGWDESRALAMSQYLDIYGMGRNLRDYLMLPWNLAFAGRFDTIRFDGAMGPFLIILLFLAVLSAILLIRGRLIEKMLKELGLMFVVSAAFFAFGTQQVRFWLPSQMLACAFVAPVVGLLVDSSKGRRMVTMTLVLLVTASLVWNTWFVGEQLFKIGYYKPVLGVERERAFLARQVPGYPVLEFANGNLPAHARILCVWTGAYGYYVDRSYYSDTFIEDVTLKRLIDASTNGKELSRRLSEAGFTHIFFRLSVSVKNMEPRQQAIFIDFLKKGSVEFFGHQDYSIFEIRQE